MLANFFDRVKGHDRFEMGKNIYKKRYTVRDCRHLTNGRSYPCGRHPWCKLAWSSL